MTFVPLKLVFPTLIISFFLPITGLF